MPLPEENILQNTDTIQEQQNPDFMTAPLTSPNPGVSNSNIPTPQEGTGEVNYRQSQDSPFSQDFLNEVYGSKKPTLTPGNLPTYTLTDVNQPRYPQFMPGSDNEETYAINQPWYKKLGNDIVKTGALAVGTFAEGMMTIPDTISAIKNGKMSDLYGSDLEKSVDGWLNNLENSFPNYYSKKEQGMNPFVQAIPFSGGAANFWFDKFLKNIGFMAGAIGSAVAQDALVGAVTSGVGDVPLISSQIGKASLWLNKILTGTGKAEDLLSTARGLGQTSERLMTLKGLQQAAAGQQVLNGTRYLTNLYGGARTMSAAAAREMYDSTKNDLLTEYTNKNGYQPIGEELQKIEDTATAAANVKFGVDTALMMVGESISFDNILRPYGTAKQKYIAEAQRTLGRDLSGVSIKEGTIDQLEYIAPKGISSIWSKVRPSIPHILNAGPILGGGMFATHAAVKSFYEDKYNGKIQGNLSDMINSAVKGLGEEFGTKEGLEAVLVGSLLGAFIGPVQKRIEMATKGTTPQSERQAAIDLLNRNTASGFMDTNFQSAAKSLSIADQMKEAINKNDVFSYENLKHQEFVNFVLSHLNNGLYDVGIEKFRLMKELPDEQFRKLFGTDDKSTTREYVDKLISKAETIKKSYDLISDTFTNPFEYNNKPRTEDQIENNDKHNVFEQWKNTLTYYSSLGVDINSRNSSIQASIREISPSVQNAQLIQLTKPENLKEYNRNLKTRTKSLEDSLKVEESTNRKEDREKLNFLNKLTTDVDGILKRSTDDHQAFTTQSDLKTLKELLDFQINGGEIGGKLEVPAEGVTQLATYGNDLNKLQTLKQEATKAYDILSTEKGFNDFYNADGEKRATQEINTQEKSQASAKPEAKERLLITNPETKKTKTYSKGQEIYIPKEGANPEKVTVIAKNEDGSITVENSVGEQEIIKPGELFKESKFNTETKDIVKIAATVSTQPPTPEGIPSDSPKFNESDPKPDIGFGIISTSTPKYEVPDTPDNNYHRREQTFLFDLGSSDSRVFNQENRPFLKIQPVTERTEESMGFPKGWIRNTGGDETSIRGVYIIRTPEGDFYSNKKGEKLEKVGGSIDPKEAIYTVLRTSELEGRYTNKGNLDEKAIQDWWENQRKYILSSDNPQAYDFTVSRGIYRKNKDVKNSVVKTKLAREEDLNKPIITIPSKGDVVVNPITDEQGAGIGATKEGVNMPFGTPLLNHGGNLVFLNNRKFSESEAENILALLERGSDRSTPLDERKQIFDYFNKLLYLRSEFSDTASKNSVTIDNGELFLGNKKEPINFSPASIGENRTEILNFLQSTFHNINKKELDKIVNSPKDEEALKFNELKIEDGKLVKGTEWPNYNHYLLSDVGGREPILSTNIAIPQEGEPPIVQKYSTLKGFEVPQAKRELPKAAPKKEEVISTEKAPAEEKENVKKVNIQPIGVGERRLNVEYEPEVDSEGNTTSVKELIGYKEGSDELKQFKNKGPIIDLLNSIIKENQIKKDDSNSKPDDMGLGDNNITAGPGAQTRYTDILPNNYERANLEEESKEFSRMIPDEVELKRVKNILKTTLGGLAWAAFQDSTVYIFENAEIGTTYHEAFEVVWGKYLWGNEQQAIYNEFTSRKGDFRSFNGENLPFSEATLKQAKEQIAEEFRDYKLTGKLPEGKQQRNFFQKLLDFIKKVIFGDPSEVNKLFKKINQGYFKDFSDRQFNPIEPAYREVEGASEAFVQDTLHGMTSELFSDIFGEDKSIITQLEENPTKAAKTIYDRLYQRMQYYFEARESGHNAFAIFNDKYRAATSDEERSTINDQLRKLTDSWGFIKDNWKDFVAEHKRYLKVFDVKFKVDDEGNIAFDESDIRDEDTANPNEYDRDIFSIDAKNSASKKVKLLFGTLADSTWLRDASKNAYEKITSKIDDSLVNMPKLAQYSRIFNYVLHNVNNLNGLGGGIYNKLRDLASDTTKQINANVRRLMNRVAIDEGFKGKTVDESKLILALENTLTKQKPSFFRQFVDDQGDTHFKTNVVSAKTSEIKQNWISNMKDSGYVRANKDGTLSFESIGKADNITFLNKLGIDISKKEYDSLNPAIQKQFNEQVSAIKGVIEDAAKNKTAISILSGDTIDLDSRLDTLSDIYVNNISGDDTQSQHLNLDNEPTSNFVLNNSLSITLNDANNSTTKEEFIAKNPHFEDIFHRDSQLINRILFKDGKFNKPVEVGIVEGRQHTNTGNNIPTSTMTKAERGLYEINNNLMGIFYTLVPADAKQEWAVHSGTYIDAGKWFSSTDRETAVSSFSSQMYNYLKTEIDLARDYENRKHVRELNRSLGKEYEGRTKGNSLRFFKDILPKEVVDKIHSDVIDQGKSLEEILPTAEMRGYMRKLALDKAEAGFKNLEDSKLIMQQGKGDSYKVYGFLKNFLDSHLGKKKSYTKDELSRLLGYREANYIISNIEMHKLFLGDPAQFSDEIKRVKSFLSGTEWSHIDEKGNDEGFNQWADINLNKAHGKTINLNPRDPGYTTFKNHVNTFTVRDILTKTRNYSLLEKELGDKAKKYLENNEADAQIWHFPTSYRETLYRSGGRFTEAQERQFDWEMAYERNREAEGGKYTYTDSRLKEADEHLLKTQPFPDSNVTYPILKLKSAGIQFKDGRAISTLDKASWAPMFYRWAEDRQMVNLYRAMRTKGTDYVRVESAHKVGIQTDALTDLYDNKGTINAAGINQTVHEEVPYKTLGVQVEQSTKYNGNTEGSQLRKIAVSDLMSDGVPVDYKGSSWNDLSETDKKKASPVYKLYQKHEEVLRAMSDKRYNNLLRRFDVHPNEDGSYTFRDKQKIANFLLSEIERRELPRNTAYAVEIDPETGDFKLPLEANVRYQEIRNILYSTIDKSILRPKVSGGQKTQLAVSMWEKEHRVFETEVNGKKVLASSELKFYDKGEDGKTTACEVYLPYHFGDKLDSLRAKFSSDKEFKEHLLDYLNKTKEGRELLSGIGFRIPTQGTNSVDFFIVKGFLPEQMGDTIILPSEITTKAGSDFDIDKLNTYLRNFYVGKDGYPHVEKFESIDSSNEQELKDYYERHLLEKFKAYKQWAEENDIRKNSSKLLDKVFGEELGESAEEPDYVPSVEEFMLDSRGKSPYEFNSIEALENHYFDVLEDLLSLPEKFKSLVSPNDSSDLKNVSLKIQKLKDPEYKEKDKSTNYGNLLDSNYLLNERHAYLLGKGGVGIPAVANTFHAVAQGVGVVITDPKLEIRLPHNTDGGNPSLSGLTLKDSDIRISSVISQFIDGFVDVSKDKFLIDMGVTRDTAKNFLTPVRWGTDPYRTALFNNQPAVQEYLRQLDINKNIPAINKDLPISPKWKLWTDTAARFGGNKRKDIQRSRKPVTYTIKDMEEMMSSYSSGKALTKGQKYMQLQLLDDYLQYDKTAWDAFKFYQGYNWDTERLGDPNMVRWKLIKYENAAQLPISSIATLLGKSFIGAHMEKVLELNNMFKELLPIQNNQSGEVLDTIARDLSKQRGLSKDDFKALMMKVELSMLDYVTQTKSSINGNSLNQYLSSLLTGNKSVASYIKKIQNSSDKRLSSNPFIQNIRADVDSRPGFPHSIQLKQKDYDPYTSNMLTDALRELRDNAAVIGDGESAKKVSDIYKNLVLASIAQSGIKKSQYSFTHLIPNEDYTEVVKGAMNNIDQSVRAFYDNHVMYRTNWSNDQLVPRIEKEIVENEQTGEVSYVVPKIGNRKFLDKLKATDQKNPTVLRLNSYDYADKRAVKTVEYLRDPKTNKITGQTVRLFKRVETGNEPLIMTRKRVVDYGGYSKEYEDNYAIFSEINKWGDGDKVQEYYEDRVDSQFPNNPKVNELRDEDVIQALHDSGFKTNAKPGDYEVKADITESAVQEEPPIPTETTPLEKAIRDLGIKKECE